MENRITEFVRKYVDFLINSFRERKLQKGMRLNSSFREEF